MSFARRARLDHGSVAIGRDRHARPRRHNRRHGRIALQRDFHPSQRSPESWSGDGLAWRVNHDHQPVAAEPVEVLLDQLPRLNRLGVGRLPTRSRQRLLRARREDAETHGDNDPSRHDGAEVRGGPAAEPPDWSDCRVRLRGGHGLNSF